MIWAGLIAPLNSRIPVISPDGKHFAYFDRVEGEPLESAVSFDLIVSTTEGRLRGRFRIPPGSIQWSNAGHVAVVNEKDGEARVIVNAEDRVLILAQIQLSPGKEPKWSHDGNKLAFVRPAETGDQLAIYDIQQSGSSPVPVPPESHWRNARILFWSPDSEYVYLLNEAGQEVALDRVAVQAGKVQELARGFELGKGTPPGLPMLSPDGSKVYLPPPRNCVVDSETSQVIWTLPEGGKILWSPWSGDGRLLFYFQSSDPTQILSHDFASSFDQVVASNVWANGVLSADGRSYFFRAPQEAIPYGLNQKFQAWLGSSWGWQQVDLSTPAIRSLGRIEFWPWEQTFDAGILARQGDYASVHFGLYEADGRLFDEIQLPTTREDLLRQLRAHRLILLTVGLYVFMAVWLYRKRSVSPAIGAFYILTLLLMVLVASQSLYISAPAASPFDVTPGETQWLAAWTTAPISELLVEGASVLSILLWALLPLALINLAICFPPENLMFVRRNSLKWAVYGVGLLPLLGIVAAPHSAQSISTPLIVLLTLAGTAAVAVWTLTLLVNYRQGSDKRSRGQIPWLAMATGLAGSGGVMLAIALVLERKFSATESHALLGMIRSAGNFLMVWAAPPAITYALTAEKPYRLRLLVRRLLRNALMALPVLLAFLLLWAAVSWLVTATFFALSAPIVTLAVIMVILLAMPFRGRLRGFVERTFDREAYEFREGLRDFARGLPHILDRRTLAASLEETLTKAMGARWHYLFVLDRRSMRLRLQPGKSPLSGGVMSVEFDLSEPLCNYLLDKERPFEVEVSPYSPELVPVFRSAADRLGMLQAAVILGLKRRHELLGLLVMGNKTSKDFYDAEDLELLRIVAREAAAAVENIDLFDELARDTAIQKELEDASDVQAQLFPADTPRLRNGQITGRCIPSRSACGDFYDFLELPGGKTGIAIGDVSGKGMAASLLMAGVQGLLRTQAPTSANLGQLVRKINQHLYGSSSGARFCTLFFGVYDDARRHLQFFNAGYPPPMVVTGDEVKFLDATGLPLGLFPEITHRPQGEVLPPGALLVLYSDGLTGAHNSRGEYFGVERLVNAVTQAREDDTDRLMARILAEVRDFEGGIPLEDDQTLIVLRTNEP